jgi:hypothetical protein
LPNQRRAVIAARPATPFCRKGNLLSSFPDPK